MSVRSAKRPNARAAKPKTTPASAGTQLEPNLRDAQNLVLRLMAIPGTSGDEAAVARFIVDALRKAGAPASTIETDQAQRKTPLAGKQGNLVLKLPGTQRAARRLLMAHMDTVPLCVGSKPRVEGAMVRSADPNTGLGADDRSGCAVLLTAALHILQHKLPHPPLTFFWAIQEEVGLFGARFVALPFLGKPKLAFNWDGGSPEKITIGATGAYRLRITIHGKASHAGVAPERGVNAIAIAGVAIGELQQAGWLGLVMRDGRRGTSNIGFVQGGGATNVVTPRVELKAECRSHDSAFRQEILQAISDAFRRAAQQVRSSEGATGAVDIEHQLDYDSFLLPAEEPCVVAASQAVQSVGLTPQLAVSNGGLDANWLSARGIPTVTMGCGQMDVHTTGERLDLAAFRQACRVAVRLATATESSVPAV